MIRLLNLHLENFMNIESLDMDFGANEVIMIYGDNGSGKSSLISAIALALLNYRKGDSYKDFIRNGCESARVILNVLYRGEPLHFDIQISDSKYSTPLSRKITFRGTTYNNSECTAFLDSLDIEYLKYAMFLFQRDNSIVDLKPSERAKLLKRLLHFEFEHQLTDLKIRLEAEIMRNKEISIRLEEASKRMFVEHELLPVQDTSAIEKEIAQLDKLIYEASSIDTDAPDVLKNRLNMLLLRKKRLEEQITSLKNANKTKQKLLDTFHNTPLPVPVPNTSDDIHLNIKKTEKMFHETETQSKILQQQLSEANEQLQVLRTGICHVCGGIVKKETVQNLEQKIIYNTQILTELNIKAKQLKDTLQDLHKKYDDAKAAEIAYEKALHEYKYLKLSVDSLPKEIAENNKLIKNTELELQSTNAEIAAVEQEIESHAEIWEKLRKADKAKIRRAELQQQIDDNIKALSINSERQRLNQKIREEKIAHEACMAEMATSLSSTATTIEVLKRAINIFEVEFPNFIILKTCSHIENYINKFICTIFPYMKVKLLRNRNGVDFYYTTTENSDEWLSVKMASGAQASILSLAWRVAVAKLYGITTLLLDEVDAAATDENSKLIYEFISSLSEIHQIVLISHRKEALHAVASLADNVSCYWVQDGVYTKVADPESLE